MDLFADMNAPTPPPAPSSGAAAAADPFGLGNFAAASPAVLISPKPAAAAAGIDDLFGDFGRVGIESTHPTDVQSPPPPLCACMNTASENKIWS